MKQSERRLLILAGAIFVVFLSMRVIPVVYGYYQTQQEQVVLLEERLDRYRDLINNAGEWTNREMATFNQIEEMQDWVFSGSTPNLIASSVQRSLRDILTSSSANIREVSVAKYMNTEGWLLVSQELSFTITPSNIPKLVEALEVSRPRLFVTRFTVSRSRNQYTGNLTVVGFSRAG